MLATDNRNRLLPALSAPLDFGLDVDRLFNQFFGGFPAGVRAGGWSAPWA